MPTLSTIIFFLLAALGLLLIPGPAVLYITTRSMAQGRRAGLVSVGTKNPTVYESNSSWLKGDEQAWFR